MRKLTWASALILTCAAGGLASAQTTGQSTTGSSSSAPAPSQQSLNSAECQKMWNSANPSGKASISQSEAQAYLKDFKRADSNNDNMISSAEFTAACSQGNVQQAAGSSGSSTGAGAGTSGAGSSSSGPGMGTGSGSGSSKQPMP